MFRAVIFDLGGTLVDKYSLSSFVNLKKAFLYRNIDLPDNLVARDMGMKKYDHIVSLSYEPAFKDMFFSVYGRRHEDNDLGDIYSIYNALQRESLKDKVKIIPEAKHACDFLRKSNIKIGITTGFNKEQMDLCIRILNKSGIYPDSAVSSACLPVVSRPEPYLIRENMKQLGIDDPKQVIKVDDTCVGIEEGHNAGCITTGVSRWSINMNVYSEADKYNLDSDTNSVLIKQKLQHCRKQLHLAEPTYLINTLNHLEYCLF